MMFLRVQGPNFSLGKRKTAFDDKLPQSDLRPSIWRGLDKGKVAVVSPCSNE